MHKRLLLLIALFSSLGAIRAQYINFKRLTTDNGLSNQFIYSINQSKNGFLYIGTGNGLSIYGGDKFTQASIKEGLADNFVTSTYEDNKNMTWIGHFQNGVSFYTNGHFGQMVNSMLGTVKVNRIIGDNRGHVFALSAGLGIVQLLDTATEKKLDINDELILDAYIHNNQYYVATPEGLKLYINKNQKFVPVELPPVLGKDKCTRVIKSETTNDYFCAISGIGIVWFKSSGEKIQIVRIFSQKDLKSDAQIKDMVIDRSNNIWVSCFDDGLRRLNCRNSNMHYYINTTIINTGNGLPSNNIECLFVDNQKNIWIGTYGDGLLQYVNEVFIEYRAKDGEDFISISADRKDNIIVVTNQGLFKTTDSSGTEDLKPLVLNNSDRKIKYVTFVNDTLFVSGELKNTIFIYDLKSGKIKEEFVFPKTVSTVVNNIFAKDHLLYVSTNQGLYILTTTLKFVKFFNHENGLLRDYVYSAFCDSGNRVWIASHGTKPYWIDPKTGEIDYSNDIQGMNIFNINGYTEDSKGNIWIATDGDGLFRYDNKDYTKFSTSDGILSNYCYGINKDVKNNIWVGHKNGLTKMDPEGKFTLFSANTQVKNIKLIENGVIKDQGGNLWFIGDKSIFKHAIQNEIRNTVPPVVVYLGAHVGDNFYKPTDTIINLKYGKYPIVFDFVCISLKDPEKVSYLYMLEGQDPKWINGSGNATPVNISGVSTGSFKFKVIAVNEDGYSTKEEVLVTINVDAPLWQKWWFILICLVAVVLVIIGLFRYRTQQLIRNKKELEQKIHEQTIEIRSEKEHVTKINKELSLVYKDLKDSINYAKNIQFSILPNFEDLKSRLRIYSYLNPKDVVGGDFYGFYDLPNKNQIVFLADCTGHGVPGGFLTVIAKALLDKIILQMKVTDCSEIIQNLNIEFRLFFGSDSQKQNIKFEGLVISICYVDYQERKMKICAAGTSVYYTNNDNEVVRFRGNRDSVGYEEKLSTIDTLELPLEQGSRVYMFSDGVQDQFGGPLYKRYSTKKLLASVDRSKDLPIEKQGEQVIKEWMEWKGAHAQIDDVAFITFEII